jgi:hypothetical protein
VAANIADDATILDDWRLLRRIPSQPGIYIIWDENRQIWKISSQAFKNHKDSPLAMSVHIERVLWDAGLTYQAVIQDSRKFALAGFAVQVARANGQTITRQPLPGDPAHAHVNGQKPKRVQESIRDAAVWVVPPPAPAG